MAFLTNLFGRKHRKSETEDLQSEESLPESPSSETDRNCETTDRADDIGETKPAELSEETADTGTESPLTDEPESETDTETDTETETDTDTEMETETDTETETETDTEPEFETESEPEPETESGEKAVFSSALTEEAHDEAEAPTRKSFWGRLKAGLSKTRSALLAPVDNLLKSFVRVDEDMLEELEEILIEADIGMTATEEILDELRERIKDGRLKDKEQVMESLREIMSDMIGESEPLHLTTSPSVLMVIGVNGAGKTTSIGKISKRLKSEGKKVVVAAADTFRAAAIDQLAVWCERAGVEMVRQSEGSDPAAVVFDAVAAAKKRGADVLIIDTAGRLQNKKNLMNELSKMNRVVERELPGADRETLLVLDATTGQNAVSQAKEFSQAAAVTGIVLNKLDGTAKGGIIISIKRELNIPVKFIGVGEKIDDMQEFDAGDFVRALFGE